MENNWVSKVFKGGTTLKQSNLEMLSWPLLIILVIQRSFSEV